MYVVSVKLLTYFILSQSVYNKQSIRSNPDTSHQGLSIKEASQIGWTRTIVGTVITTPSIYTLMAYFEHVLHSARYGETQVIKRLIRVQDHWDHSALHLIGETGIRAFLRCQKPFQRVKDHSDSTAEIAGEQHKKRGLGVELLFLLLQ
jgi:hypothetical protein